MTQRGLLTTVGAAALGAGLLLGGGAATPTTLAQQATPPATTSSATTDQTPAQRQAAAEQQQKQAYDAFVASLAKELGVDASKVDAAIRTTLKQQVDERQAAGDIDKVQAAARKAAIDASDAPLFLGVGGPGGMHDFEGGDHGSGRGPRGGDSTRPGPQPGDDAPANQNGTAPVSPADGAAV